MLNELRAYLRFLRRFPGFLNQRMSLAEARQALRRRTETREARFLQVLNQAVFNYPPSPYLPLFEMADCSFSDVEDAVRRRGLEGALHELHEAGVYVTFEEFKGRRPIVRDGREMPVNPRAFDNPYLDAYWRGSSSGSSGKPTRTAIDLENVLETTPFLLAAYAAHEVVDVPGAYWWGILPGVAGLRGVLRSSIFGNPPRRWFTPVRSRDVRLPLKHRMAIEAIVMLGRMLGHAVPLPEPLPLNEPGALLEWVRVTLEEEGRCMVYTTVSAATRLALAARDRGVRLDGCTIHAGGEPTTPAKLASIKGAGAAWFPIYGMSEAGCLGMGCADETTDDDDLHVAMDGLALIQRPVQVEGWPFAQDALFATSLLDTAPKLLLNLETDDCGVMETRPCGCLLGELGMTQHVSAVRSYRKVTGEGITLVDADMVKILEEVLPGRFGGSPLDYQFVEEEDENGLTRLSLFVSPHVELPSEETVVDAVLEAVRQAGLAGAFSAAFWEQGDSLRVRRREPLWNAGGKFLPLKAAESRRLAREPQRAEKAAHGRRR